MNRGKEKTCLTGKILPPLSNGVHKTVGMYLNVVSDIADIYTQELTAGFRCQVFDHSVQHAVPSVPPMVESWARPEICGDLFA